MSRADRMRRDARLVLIGALVLLPQTAGAQPGEGPSPSSASTACTQRIPLGSPMRAGELPTSHADLVPGRRSPVLAGILGLVPGLGHLYVGETGRGLLIAGTAFGTAAATFGNGEVNVRRAGAVAYVGASLVSVTDAARAATRYNRRRSRLPERPVAGSACAGSVTATRVRALPVPSR